MEILINTKQLKQLKDTYKKKYVDNNELYKSPKLCNGVNQNLNKLKIIDIIEQYGELVSLHQGVLTRENPIGVGEDGTPIQLYTLDKTKTEKPIILVVGGVHGDEKTSIHGIYKTVEFLLDSSKWSRFITSNFVIQIIPCLNGYGFNNNKRNNANDKDLNRDFIACTQKETKALTQYINKNKDRIKIILDSHNAYNEEFVSCKQEMKFFEEYEDVAFKLNLFLNGKYEVDDKKSFLWISRSQNDGTLSDFINKNKFIGHTVESPRSLTKEIHYPKPINYEDGAEVTIDLLVNLMYIYGKMYNSQQMKVNESRIYLDEGHLRNKSDLGIFEQGFLSWLQKHSQKGMIKGTCKQQLENALFRNMAEEFEYDMEDSYQSWTWGGNMTKKVAVPYINTLLKQNVNPFIENDDYGWSIEELMERYHFMACQSLVDCMRPPYGNELYLKCLEWWKNERLHNSLFKYDNRGMIKLERAIAIPKRGFKKSWMDGTYEEYLEDRFEGIGHYWSYGQGEILFWDEMTSYDGYFILYLRGYVPYSSISIGDTLHTWQQFDSEEEITLQRGKPVELYKIVIYDPETKESALLPMGGRIIINA